MSENNKWIPVSERLPEDNKTVNITWVNRKPEIYYKDIKDKPFTATGVYYQGNWYWWNTVVEEYLAEYGKYETDKINACIEVIAWMPLPEPYREGSNTVSTEELKPCPFCGGEAEYFSERIYSIPLRNVSWDGIKCTKCGAAYINTDKTKCPNDIYKAWNRRTEND